MKNLFIFLLLLLLPTQVFSAPDVSLNSAGQVPGGPFQSLQDQIDAIQLLPGPTGATGSAGSVGPAGPAGLTGATGLNGFDGLDGSAKLEWQFEGNTISTTIGSSGFGNLSNLCSAEVSPDSRPCYVKEVFDTPGAFASFPQGYAGAWVQDRSGVAFLNASGGSTAISEVGRYIQSGVNINLNCGGWSNTSLKGELIASDGFLSLVSCTEQHFVACCTLK